MTPRLSLAWRITAATLLAGSMALAQTNTEPNLEDQIIPPLRPARGEIVPGFWEQYWWVAILVLLAASAASLLVWRQLSKPDEIEAPPPRETARKALEMLKAEPENSQTLSELVRVVRRYFVDTFSLTQTELTSRQLGEVLRDHDHVDGEVVAAAIRLLETCERRQFDPRQAIQTSDLLGEALKLIEETERTRRGVGAPSTDSKAAS